MKKIYTLATFLFLLTITSAPVQAARPTGGTTPKTPLGVDVSWPQCGKRLPTDHAFGIVGVNGGLATTTNPCLKDQLLWANTAVGGTNQAKVQLYVNTANPGGMGTPSWPSSDIDSAGNLAPNPYDTCDNRDTLACAWQYGWNRALEDVRDRFQPAALLASVSSDPATYTWWLDVETENTWKLGGTSFDHQSNTAVLEGMTEYFESVSAKVGLYAPGLQWKEITGDAISPTSNLVGLDNWRPGGASLNTAKQACNAVPLTAGGRVVLTQFVSKNLDYNYSCI